MSGKKCFKCGAVKNLSEFYRHSMMADGYLNKCKECTKADVSKHRAENIEKIREYDRDRSKLPHRIEKNRIVSAEWRKSNPERRKAQLIAGYAIKKGFLVKQPCLICGKKAQAHHPDYDLPLSVVWLCSSHHKQTHHLIK